MTKNTIITIVLIVLGLFGLAWWGRSNQAASNQTGGSTQSSVNSKSSLVAKETFYDFGTISMKNGLVEHIFKVTNSSDKDIYIKKVNTSCMCTSAYLETASGEKGPFKMEGMGYLPPANETIKAGESWDVKVVYDPNAHGPAGVGAIDRLIYLTDEFGSTFQFEIKAVVTP